MDYSNFKKMLGSELPLNRKERFYTATILPSLLLHKGVSNFFHFLRQIRNFPTDINEENTRDSFLFYTEYNLKESAGKKSVGAEISVSSGDTPDAIIEVLKPQKVFVVIECKMFENLPQLKLSKQMNAQRFAIIEALKGKYNLHENQVFHIALVPRALGFQDTLDYQVINWEVFIENKEFKIDDNYFYNFLIYALEQYNKLVGDKVAQASTVIGYKTGEQIFSSGGQQNNLWIGRKGGKTQLVKDIKEGKWRSREYCFNKAKPPKGQRGNWIKREDFITLIEEYKKDEI